MLETFRKALDLFDRRERWKLVGLFMGVVMMGLAQMAGVASIMPFMALVGDPSIVHTNERLNWVYTTLGFTSETNFLFATGLGVLVLIALSNGVVAFTTWLILRFTWEKHRALSVQLLQRYLDEPYSFYLSRNSSKLAKNILGEVTSVVKGVLVPCIKALAKMVIVLMILGLLVATDPLLALTSAAVLGGMYGFIYLVIRRKQLRLGREKVRVGAVRFKSATEALTGIKDVKVLGREADFLDRFAAASGRYSSTQASNETISDLPKFALDTVAFGGILLIVLFVLRANGDVAAVLPIVGLYAFAAYRLMPALQTIFASLAKIRFNSPALEVLHDDLTRARAVRPPAADATPVTFDQAIEFQRVSFRYPSSESWVLNEVSFRIPKNSTVGLVGTTGAGKTTLVDLLLGLLEPQEGCVAVDGVPITTRNVLAWRKQLGYVPQSIFLTDDTIARNIAFGIPVAQIDQAAVERAARIANVHDFIAGLPEGYATVVGDRGVRLSGGQRQRLGIARALYHDPAVLVLDEATSALDGVTEEGVMQAISGLASQKTIILIAHRLTTLRSCDTIFMFGEGRLIDQGRFSELLEANTEFREMARMSMRPIDARLHAVAGEVAEV